MRSVRDIIWISTPQQLLKLVRVNLLKIMSNKLPLHLPSGCNGERSVRSYISFEALAWFQDGSDSLSRCPGAWPGRWGPGAQGREPAAHNEVLPPSGPQYIKWSSWVSGRSPYLVVRSALMGGGCLKRGPRARAMSLRSAALPRPLSAPTPSPQSQPMIQNNGNQEGTKLPCVVTFLCSI